MHVIGKADEPYTFDSRNKIPLGKAKDQGHENGNQLKNYIPNQVEGKKSKPGQIFIAFKQPRFTPALFNQRGRTITHISSENQWKNEYRDSG